MDKNDLFERIKYSPEDISSTVNTEEGKYKQIQMIYKTKTKIGEECNNNELLALIIKNEKILNTDDVVYVSPLELAILNDIAIMYDCESSKYNEYGQLFSAELKRYIDENIYDIVKSIANDANISMKEAKESMPQYYNMKLNEFGKKNLVLSFRTSNIYKKILQIQKKDKEKER